MPAAPLTASRMPQDRRKPDETTTDIPPTAFAPSLTVLAAISAPDANDRIRSIGFLS